MTLFARRALLFMPADSRRKIEKAITLDADAVILDLEDGVAPSEKEAARAGAAAALQELDFGGRERIVRINPVVDESSWVEDLIAAAHARPDTIMLPKVESPDAIAQVSAILDAIEADHDWVSGDIGIIALIESARGVAFVREIAMSGGRLSALAFGAEDLAGDLGATRTRVGDEVAYGRSAVVLHAKAFGLEALDTPHTDLQDIIGLTEAATRAAGMGYTGKLAIHPNQIAPIIAAFTPSSEAIDAARHLIEQFERHAAEGSGVFAYEGKMVEMPMVRAARNVLRRARF